MTTTTTKMPTKLPLKSIKGVALTGWINQNKKLPSVRVSSFYYNAASKHCSFLSSTEFGSTTAS